MRRLNRNWVVWLLVGPLFLLLAWGRVEHLEEEIDLFPFIEFEQAPKWYVHYTAYHIISILQYLVIYMLIRKYEPRIKLTATVLLLFSIFRLSEYWLFRHHVPFEGIITAAAFISLGTYYYRRWRDGYSR